MDQMNTK